MPSLGRWRRTIARMQQMSQAELRHRARVALRRRFGWLPWLVADARRDDGWVARLAAHETARAELPAYLARVLASRVYGPDWSPGHLAAGLARAGAAERLVAEADAIRAHRVRVLAYGQLDLGQPIDWHRDPLTGGQWPRHYSARAACGEARGLDPKVVWEPNRHQHLQTLAAAAVLTGNAGYADEVAEHLTSWIEQNAPGVGIHWVESTEPAARLLAWLWALPLVLDSRRFTPEVCLRVLRSMVAQARHIAANLSLYSSPNTHLLLEALALFVLGTVLPELSGASAWRTRGREILEREIEVQVGDDGFYREASTYYHAYAVEFYVLASVIAERNGERLAPVVATRLQRMLEALAWLTRPDGTLPNIGDADGGRTLRLGAPALAGVTELLAAGAVLMGRAELRAGLPASGEEAAWLWPDALDRLERLGPAAPPRGGRQFPDARLAVERRDVNGDERWMLFDGGDLGMLAGGHGHAGCLGLGLYANGRALIVDRGTYVYNAAPAWRRYFRGTRAHSTVVVDGVDQAEPGVGNFQWVTRYESRLVRHLTTAEYTLVTGEHDGYQRLAAPVRHRRSLLSVAGEYWLCIDTLIGTGAHNVEFLFQLAPGLEPQTVGDAMFAAVADATAGLLIAPAGVAGAQTRVMTGATEPLQGWHSDDYGDRRPAPTVVTTAVVQLPAVVAHVLAPCARAPHARPVVESRRVDAGLSITVRTADTTDLVLCSADEPRLLAAHGVAFVGELLHARLDNAGMLRRFLAVQARSVAWRGDALMGTGESGESADWVVRDADQVFGRS